MVWIKCSALSTSQGQWELRIDLKLINGTIIYLPYNKFAVGPVTEQYPLTISGFTGYTTDPISGSYNLNTMKFTTRDQDNDRTSINCAINNNRGGWWHNNCTYIYPNSQYNYKYAISLNGQWHSSPFIEMKIRPKNCT